MKPIDICRNQELISDINKVFEKHGLNVFDTSIEIESNITANLGYNIVGHKMYINTLLLHLFKECDGGVKNSN